MVSPSTTLIYSFKTPSFSCLTNWVLWVSNASPHWRSPFWNSALSFCTFFCHSMPHWKRTVASFKTPLKMLLALMLDTGVWAWMVTNCPRLRSAKWQINSFLLIVPKVAMDGAGRTIAAGAVVVLDMMETLKGWEDDYTFFLLGITESAACQLASNAASILHAFFRLFPNNFTIGICAFDRVQSMVIAPIIPLQIQTKFSAFAFVAFTIATNESVAGASEVKVVVPWVALFLRHCAPIPQFRLDQKRSGIHSLEGVEREGFLFHWQRPSEEGVVTSTYFGSLKIQVNPS